MSRGARWESLAQPPLATAEKERERAPKLLGRWGARTILRALILDTNREANLHKEPAHTHVTTPFFLGPSRVHKSLSLCSSFVHQVVKERERETRLLARRSEKTVLICKQRPAKIREPRKKSIKKRLARRLESESHRELLFNEIRRPLRSITVCIKQKAE